MPCTSGNLQRFLLSLAGLILLMPAALAAAAPPRGPEPLPTRWMAPPGVERLPHRVWEAVGPLSARQAGALAALRGGGGRVAIVVQEALYTDIAASLAQYQADLAGRGLGSVVTTVAGGSPEELRDYLIGLYGEPEGLVGAVLVGDVPYLIYEMMQDWDGEGGEPPEYEDFPCDIYFMDMNGTWLDDGAGGTVPAGNGKYDGWSDPAHELEIWVGRLRVDTLPLMGTPADLLNNYFRKNHLYRKGDLVPETPSASALVYVDDDWGNMVEGPGGDAWCVEQVYGDVTCVFDVGSNPGNNATADNYKNVHMSEDYQLVFLRSHGYPGGHGFYQNYRNWFRYVYCRDYVNIDPRGLFYSLFVCSGCDYTAEYGEYQTYLGGAIAFNEAYGLVSWGSAKTGGLWNDPPFYTELAEPGTLGAAFVRWFNESHALYPAYAPRWWYGMVMIGDPALIPNGDYFEPQAPADLAAESRAGQIRASWRANGEADLDHYHLYRAPLGLERTLVASIPAPDTAYADADVDLDSTYVYWVSAVDTVGNESAASAPDTCTYVGATEVASAGAGASADSPGRGGRPVLWSRPNPFGAATEIGFSLEREGVVALRVYDASGRCVRTLSRGEVPARAHSIIWDGRDDRGIRLAPGVYVCRLETEGAGAVERKLLLLK